MKQDARRHSKIILAARDLGIDRCHLLGILSEIWGETGARFPSGDIGRASNEEIAAYIDYSGDPDALIAVLVKRRLLDEVSAESGRLIVHDWHEHCEDWVRGRLRDRKLIFANGHLPYNPRKPQDPPENPGKSRNLPEDTGKSLARVPPPLPKPLPKPPPLLPDEQTGVGGGWPEDPPEVARWRPYRDALFDHFGRFATAREWDEIFSNLERYDAEGLCPSLAGWKLLCVESKDRCLEKHDGMMPKTAKVMIDELADVVEARRQSLSRREIQARPKPDDGLTAEERETAAAERHVLERAERAAECARLTAQLAEGKQRRDAERSAEAEAKEAKQRQRDEVRAELAAMREKRGGEAAPYGTAA